jgi:hypothetical protein
VCGFFLFPVRAGMTRFIWARIRAVRIDLGQLAIMRRQSLIAQHCRLHELQAKEPEGCAGVAILLIKIKFAGGH